MSRKSKREKEKKGTWPIKPSSCAVSRFPIPPGEEGWKKGKRGRRQLKAVNYLRPLSEVLSRLISIHGAPLYLRSDNGPEFVSHAVLKWLHQSGIDTALIDPGKPWQNGADESFNGRFRDECMSMEWFRSRAEARVVIELWRQHYNADRPHLSLGYLSPLTFKRQDPEQQNRILQKQQRKQNPATNQGAILN